MIERRYIERPDGLDEHGHPAIQVVSVEDNNKGSLSAPQYIPQYGDGRRSVFAFEVEPVSPSSVPIPQTVLRKPDYIKTNNEPREPRNSRRPGSATSVQSRDSYSSGDGDDDSDGGGTLCSPEHPAKKPKKTRHRRSSGSSVGSTGSAGSSSSHASRSSNAEGRQQKKVRVIQLTGSAPYPPPDPYADKHHYAHPQPHVPNHRSTSPPPRGRAVEVHLGDRNNATLAYVDEEEEDEDYSAHMRYEAATAAAIAARNKQKQKHNLHHNVDGSWEVSDQGVDNDPRYGNGRHNHIHVDNRRY